MNFLNPLFSLGILAATMPVLLHLIRREHARRVEFPSLMFLHRISRKTIRYQKLRHLLLLLLRVLAFVLVALAFTRPYFKGAQASALALRSARTHVIAIDNSMSMSYRGRWERALAEASKIVRSIAAGDRVAVMEFSDRVAVKTRPTTNKTEALYAIEKGIELTDRATSYGQALRAAEKLAADGATAEAVIYWISDFQKNAMAPADQELHLSPGIELEPVDVGSNEFSNLAISSVRIEDLDSGGSGNLVLRAVVVCYGSEECRNVRVELFADSRKISEKRIDVLRNSSAAVDFTLPGLTAGMHPVVLQLEDPNLTRDNRFYLVLTGRGKISVSSIEGSQAERRRSPRFFLLKALNLDRLSPYRLSLATPNDPIPKQGILIWNDAWGASQTTQRRLRDFVLSGGGLIIVVSGSVRAADFNRSFGLWLPLKIAQAPPEIPSRVRPAQDYLLMTDIRMDHPIFQPFRGPRSGFFLGARFYRHARLVLEPGVESIARFDNGDPALVAVKLGKGRVLVFASSADDTDNDFPLKALYAPFWHQMLRYVEGRQEKRYWFTVGETISLRKEIEEVAASQRTSDAADADAIFVLMDPGKSRLPVGSGVNELELAHAGFYEVRGLNWSVFLAVNPVPAESDLARSDPEETTARFISSERPRLSRQEDLSPDKWERRQQIWSLILAAVLLLFISELILSNSLATSGKTKPDSGLSGSGQ